ncbi:hypothetical protein [Metabacillus malikii]|uniref:Uncharacterized protein n=1 Tax=Metabacillus malikii TaxID=1504265 RepID=A0ABT9ZL53_9BACI|nr:hypothetical protein [Metabacillus malikii]MDQ0233026.1 hypothetical protein [Metabacillus malikii]
MSKYSTFRVIKIIDEYSLVINGGLSDDISMGDEIEIFLEGEKILDPFNDNINLGTLDFIKDRLEVTEVYPKFSVCKKIATEKINKPSALQKALSVSAVSAISGIPSLYGTTETRTTVQKINIDKNEITGRTTGEKIIKIGDIARIALSD